jgi:hypothetical protein
VSPARRGASRPLPPRRAPEPVAFERKYKELSLEQGWDWNSSETVLISAIESLPVEMQRRALEHVRKTAREENADGEEG